MARAPSVVLKQTGSAQYQQGPPAVLSLTTNMATAMGKTAAPGKSIDLPVKFSDACPKP